MTATEPHIRVSRRVTIMQQTPYNAENYPGMTLEQAVAYERGRPDSEKLESFIEAIEFLPPERVHLSDSVLVIYAPKRKEE